MKRLIVVVAASAAIASTALDSKTFTRDRCTKSV
jgi:hypothetical protein